MPHAIPFPPPGFDDLDIEAQYAYLRDLEDYLADQHGELSESQHQLVMERLAEHQANPTDTVPGAVMREAAYRYLHEIQRARRESA